MEKSKTWTIFGIGNFIHDIVEAIQLNQGVIKYVVLNQAIPSHQLKKLPLGIKVIKFEQSKSLPETDYYFFGFVDSKKQLFFKELNVNALKFPNLIHPKASISSTVKLGQGNFIGSGSILAPQSKLGQFNIVNRGVTIGHDTVIGDYNNLGPASTVSGLVTIGNKNFLGANCTIIDNLEIKNDLIIGAGAVVTKSLTKPGTYVGVPAKLF